MPRIRILIADDHALVRASLRGLLAAQPDFEIAGEASDGVAAVEACRQLLPDVALMDASMPGRDGISATSDIREASPNTKVLVLTLHEEEIYVRQALRAGAAGYALKRSRADELIAAIRMVHGGAGYVAPSLVRTHTAGHAGGATSARRPLQRADCAYAALCTAPKCGECWTPAARRRR